MGGPIFILRMFVGASKAQTRPSVCCQSKQRQHIKITGTVELSIVRIVSVKDWAWTNGLLTIVKRPVGWPDAKKRTK